MVRTRLVQIARIGITAGIVALVAAFAPSAQAAPPVLSVPGPQTISEGQLLEFQVTAVDADGQTVTLSAAFLPAGASFTDNRNDTGLFSWTPALDQSGDYSVSFLADDEFGGTDIESVSIQVLNTNNPPEMSPIGDRSVERGSLLFVSLSGFDPEGDPLSYSTVDLPSYGTLTDNGDGSGYLTFAPSGSTPLGTTSMTVILSDGALTASETFNVTVTSSSGQTPPVLAAIGNKTVAEGSGTSVTVSATDGDGDALIWSISLPGFANFTVTSNTAGSSTGRLDLNPGFCAAGSYPANISVNDGTFSDSEAFTIVVTDVNRLPAWSEPSGGYALSFEEGAAATLAVSATDPDQACGGQAPALFFQSSNAGGALVVSLSDAGNGTGTLHVSAGSDAAGTYQVVIRAKDRANSALVDDATVRVTVTAGEEPVVARAWTDADPLRLDIGKPREKVYLEPVEGTFALESVVLGSIRLKAWEGAGAVADIAPLPDRYAFGLDRNQNGVSEVRMEFGKEDLRALLGNLVDPMLAGLTLCADLTDGRKVETQLEVMVEPERKRAIKRMGPNPLNPEAVITIHLEQQSFLKVRIFDLSGRLVRTLIDTPSAAAGDLDLRFDGRDQLGRKLPSGRYFVRAELATGNDSNSITLLK